MHETQHRSEINGQKGEPTRILANGEDQRQSRESEVCEKAVLVQIGLQSQ